MWQRVVTAETYLFSVGGHQIMRCRLICTTELAPYVVLLLDPLVG